MKHLERRDFVKLMGAGIYILFSTEEALFSQMPGNRAGSGYPDDFNAYLRIAEDGHVTCYSGKVELGQGITASLAQMLAEDLETSYESITMVFGDTKLCPWDGGTNGSRSIKYFGPALRAAGAEAREVLIQLAAEQLKIASDSLSAKNGVVFEKTNPANKVSYGSLTQGKTIERHMGKKPELKQPSVFTVCGKSLPRADIKDKVMGKAKFAGDLRLAGMLYGKVLRPPSHGAQLKKVDVSAANAIKDTRVFQEGDFIGVVHALPDMAEIALSLIKAEYEMPPANIDDKNIHQRIIDTSGRDNIVEQKGDLMIGEKQASTKFEEIYRTPYIAHAPIETHTAIANVERDSATVWVGTQRPFGANQEIGRAIGMNSDQIRIITPYVGGGFGGKSQVAQAVQAARLSRLAGSPVQVAWSREEEFFYDTFQPAAVVRIRSGIDPSNRITFWDYNVLFAGDRSSQNIYNVPNLRTTSRGNGFGGGGPHPFPTGAWRGPGSNTNIFSRESHMDIMAAKIGIDPLEFRLKNLSDPRMVRVIHAAAEKFGWKPGKAPTGQGRGMACLDYLGTYVALMAKIKANKAAGTIKVERIVCAVDMGPVINPGGARIQIEGCVMMGLGYCLSEEIHFTGGEIKDLGFESYTIPKFSWMPEIEPVLVENKDIAPSGCGEPPIVGMGALLANALFDAIGIRAQQLPLSPERIAGIIHSLNLGEGESLWAWSHP
jgi:nicotinate dehydrogenase subunit B